MLPASNLGAQNYSLAGRFNGKPAAILAVYQLPGSNAVSRRRPEEADGEAEDSAFPHDLDYAVSLDTTPAVTEGMKEISERC